MVDGVQVAAARSPNIDLGSYATPLQRGSLGASPVISTDSTGTSLAELAGPEPGVMDLVPGPTGDAG